MELEKLLDTKEKRKLIINELRALQESGGWKFIEAVLRFNVDRLQGLINDIDASRSSEEEWRLKVKRQYQQELLDLPSKFASDLMKSDDVDWVDLDPYE